MATRAVSPVFVGRTDDLDVLLRALDRAASGDPAMVVLGGEAGVGKSRLLEEFAERARAREALVLVGGNVELGEEGMAFAPLSAALRGLLHDLPAAESAALLAPGRDELARLLPELGPVAAPAAAGRGRLFEVFLDLLDRLAQEHPVVLMVEDMHWADRSTRELMAFLARSLRAARVLIVATYRSDELPRGHPLRLYLAELDRVRTVERHQLERLSRAAVADQLAGLLGRAPDPAMVERLFERSEGNAFFVEELACAELDDADCCRLTDSLRELLLSRLERLSPRTQQLLRVASASGRRVDYPLLAAVTDLTEEQLTDALREAVSGHALIADADDTGFSFRHSLVREALHEDLLPGEHGRVHVRYAEALERDPGLVSPSRLAAEIAHHWHAAHDAARGVPAALAAAQAARDVYAFAEQRLMLERALEMWDQVPAEKRPPDLDHAGLLTQAGRAAFKAGDQDRALALIHAALDEVDPAVEPDRRALLLEQGAVVLANLGRPAELDTLRAAAALLTPTSPAAARARVLGSLARALMLNLQHDEAMALALEAAERAQVAGERALATDAEITIASLLVFRGSCEEGVARLSAALAAAEDELDPWVMLRARTNLSDALERLGRYEESAAVAREGAERANRVGRGRTSGAFLTGNVVDALLSLGRWDEASDVLSEALDLRPAGVQGLTLHMQRARLMLARGAVGEAEHSVGIARGLLSRQHPNPQYETPLATVEADLAVLHHDPGGALTALEPVLAGEGARAERYDWPALATAARAAADLSERARDLRAPDAGEVAAGVAARVREVAGRLGAGASPDRAWQALVAAEMARAQGSSDTPTAWAAAVAAWESVGSPYPLAYSCYRGAEAAAVAGDRPSAEAAARRAAALAGELGAAPLLAEVEGLARRARLKLADGPASTGAADEAGAAQSATVDAGAQLGLTGREVEVLRAITAGQSNRQIAEGLFISVKTVSVHVSNILAKLGVAGRGEAAAVAHRLGLFEAGRLGA